MEWLLLVLIVVLVVLPPKYDPAIRWKEFNEAWRERLEKRDRSR